MKDYTFSEMLDICREYDDCAGCPFETICQNGIASVSERDIEPRDMIELPCKELIKYQCKPTWVVHYRDKKFGFYTMMFDSESEADAFLASLKKS